MFSSQSMSRVNNIRTTLINAQKGNQTVAAYFASLRGLADELAAAGKAIQDDELISYIIHGLDIDYQPLVSALDARVTPVSLDELYTMLSNFDQRMAQFNHSGGGFRSSALTWPWLFPQQGEAWRRWWRQQWRRQLQRPLRCIPRSPWWWPKSGTLRDAPLPNLWQARAHREGLLVSLR
uniref:Uncharacterized protein n=1 Tax=Aegilops tauschii subsp. strangulata TaxID=200361 RepID=A0A453J8Z3_AEGTS